MFHGKFGMSNRFVSLKKFWKNKTIFLTGHTGFKGSWLVIFFNLLGAKVYGYSLKQKKLSLFNITMLNKILKKSVIGDIRNQSNLKKHLSKCKPDFLIHMAAQPLVRDSYDDPRYTFEVNTLGTLNILEAVREIKTIKNVLIITTDKVYKNENKKNFFSENDELGGDDPYSNSKACAELICQSYSKSFFSKHKISCVTARAGNVIGGGDFAKDRVIPDFFRSLKQKKILYLRYPKAIRPWQHVIEPLYGYILLLMKMSYKNKNLVDGSWNFGPKKCNNINVNKVISILNKNFKNKVEVKVKSKKKNSYKESNILKLSSAKSKKNLGWEPKYNIAKSLRLITEWEISYSKNKKKLLDFTKGQINNYLNQF
tara:strand:- start:4325 stop:5431 length:1107 start_codon:yes stop_codon:yes gene_type:complete